MIPSEYKRDLIEDSIRVFGVPAQFRQLHEEIGELMVAVSHYQRGRCTLEEVTVEIADVLQMISAVRQIFGITDEMLDRAEDQQWTKLRDQLASMNTSDVLTPSENPLIQIQDLIDDMNQDPVTSSLVCELSDGHHTYKELYRYRMLYNAALFNELNSKTTYKIHKSLRHFTGEECFGGGWFIVMAELPTGQVSNHYRLADWNLFKVPTQERADEWDGHTPEIASQRLTDFLEMQ